MAPASAGAQGLDPAALEAELEAVAGAGGMPAPAPEPDLAPTAVPEAPTPAPEALDPAPEAQNPTSEGPPEAPNPVPVPDAAAELATEILSETANEPAPESVPQPSYSAAPTNINVDIRILSPGDNGDVSQAIEVPVDLGLPPQLDMPSLGPIDAVPDLGGDWNWIWNWDAACAPDGRASAADWNWIWNWGGDCAGGPQAPDWRMPDWRMPELPVMPGIDSIGEGMGELPAVVPGTDESVTESDVVLGMDEPSRTSRDRVEAGGVHATSRTLTEAAGAGYPLPPTGAAALAKPAPRAAPHAVSGHGEHGSGQGSGANTILPALPALAASVSSSGGSTAPLAAALLALLCLLAPRALELAHPRFTKLSSLLSSSRLERPG